MTKTSGFGGVLKLRSERRKGDDWRQPDAREPSAEQPCGPCSRRLWCRRAEVHAAMTTLGYTPLTVRETAATGHPKPRLLDRVREAIRARHYSTAAAPRRPTSRGSSV